VIVLLWYFFTLNQNQQQALKLPRPALLISTLHDNGKTILNYSYTTWYRVILGLLIGTITGMFAGILMTYKRIFYFILDPIIEIIRPIPPIALIPFFILWLGLGDTSQFLLIGLGCFMIITVSTFVGITNVSPVYVRAAMSLGASKRQLYKTVYIPAMTPGLLSGVRVALASAFALTVAAEYLGAQGGLGYLIRNSRVTLHTETIMLASIIIGLESLITDQLLRVAFKHITKWLPKSF
jgi:ABC-type nitrate/sulfonate/bicarbonate transport system permease component